MTPEEMQRTMEFIVQQQAQFAVNIQLLQEERMRDSARIARLGESFPLPVQLAQTTTLDRTSSNPALLRFEANIAAIGEAKEHVEERLSALIKIVREQRNGRSS